MTHLRHPFERESKSKDFNAWYEAVRPPLCCVVLKDNRLSRIDTLTVCRVLQPILRDMSISKWDET